MSLHYIAEQLWQHDFVFHRRISTAQTLTAAQVDTRCMIDVEVYHMLHDKEASEAVGIDSPIIEDSIDRLKDTEELLLRLPLTIKGFKRGGVRPLNLSQR